MTIHTYKVIGGPFKDKIVKSFEDTLFKYPHLPTCVFDDKGNEYIVSIGELEWLETTEEEDPSYETAKEFGFKGTYEDYLECLNHYI